jgi:uncharacterized protein YkwD
LGNPAVLDAAVVVRDARHTAFESDTLVQRLTQAGVRRWHLVENFT